MMYIPKIKNQINIYIYIRTRHMELVIISCKYPTKFYDVVASNLFIIYCQLIIEIKLLILYKQNCYLQVLRFELSKVFVKVYT